MTFTTTTTTGVPTADDVRARLALINGLTLTDPQSAYVDTVLANVLADFQSPTGLHGSGGTGRQFIAAQGIKLFDGLSKSELYVPDIIPPTVDSSGNPVDPMVVNYIASGAGDPFYMYPFADVIVKTDYRGLGYNVLMRRRSLLNYSFTLFSPIASIFPRGHQNIQVQATWGVSVFPTDAAQAIISEAAARLLILLAPISGYGSTVKIESMEIREASSTADLNMVTSPIVLWREEYKNAVARYRDKGVWKFANLAPRMA